MLPGNVDPRRPEKVQRYAPKSGNGQDDLTPDYMNILGQHPTTANAGEAPDKFTEPTAGVEPNLQVNTPLEDDHINSVAVTSTATNVIPTSPQYGVAIIPSNAAVTTAYLPTETITSSTDTVTDTTAKPPDESKDLQSTPSRNDRFKVVKIASLEPFKRGRWKCMDYVDEQPPQSSQSKVSQSAGNIQMSSSGVYLQTQSMPQQQIHQYLLQGGFTNGTQFFPNVTAQMIPQNQYFYPQVTNMQTQTLPQQVPSSMPAQFINSAQAYFPSGVVQNPAGFNVQSYPNVQYVPANIIQNQNSAFVPTSQTVQLPTNFQQSQTYAGQPNVSQSNVGQPLVNGHTFPPQNDQQVTSSLPTQTAKSVILNSNIPQPVVSHTQINQTNVQNQIPMQNSNPAQNVSVIQSQQYQPNTPFQQTIQSQPQQNQNNNQPVAMGLPANMTQVVHQHIIQGGQVLPVQSQNFDQSIASNVYTNPQFVMSGSATSLTNLENNEASADAVTEPSSITEPVSESADDPAKTNPVVNAIDNKIEQAMDLVKSHLMYTVREEVEVLKEKIADLMEKIQQLETENNYLKMQIPKNVPPTATSNPNPVSNPTPITQSNAPPVSNPSPNIIPNTQQNLLQNPTAEPAPSQ